MSNAEGTTALLAQQEAREVKVDEVERSLSPVGAGSNLHALAEYWDRQEGPRFKRLYKIWHLAQKDQPRKVALDDNLRVAGQNEKELVVMVNPTHSNFFMHYDKVEDVVHFIIDGHAAIVPNFWLKSFAKNFRNIQAKEGHAMPLPSTDPGKPTLGQDFRYRLRLLRAMVTPLRPKEEPQVTLDKTIVEELAQIEALQRGPVGLIEEPR
jgi:hypothetical protein